MLKLLHAQLSTVAIQLRGTAEGFDLDIQLASLPEVLHTQADALESMAQSRRPCVRRLRPRRGLGCPAATVALRIWSAKPRCFLRKLRGFAERVRGLGGESVTQATGIMIAGFPAAAAGQPAATAA